MGSAEEALTERLAKLEVISKEYDILKKLITVVHERGIMGDVVINISKNDLASSSDWLDILKMAKIEEN